MGVYGFVVKRKIMPGITLNDIGCSVLGKE
jgi:hypothetical protein